MVRGGAEGRVVETGPQRMGKPGVRWPCGEGPEITRRVVFWEGRGLRARGARPEAGRG